MGVALEDEVRRLRDQVAAREAEIKRLGRELFEVEAALDVEKRLREALEDVVKATAKLREQS